MEKHPFLHLGLVAIEKGTFGSPLTTTANFTYFFMTVLEGLLLVLIVVIKIMVWYQNSSISNNSV